MVEGLPDISVSIPMRDGFPAFSKGEIERRHALLREVMARHGVRGLIAYGSGRFNAQMLC